MTRVNTFLRYGTQARQQLLFDHQKKVAPHKMANSARNRPVLHAIAYGKLICILSGGLFLSVPCRTSMRGSFLLNGTYFQVNEVFVNHESSQNPLNDPRSLIWYLPRRTVYCGTSISAIFKDMSLEAIQHCFWRGYVCVRGFDRKTRAPCPLVDRIHFPASKMAEAEAKVRGSLAWTNHSLDRTTPLAGRPVRIC